MNSQTHLENFPTIFCGESKMKKGIGIGAGIGFGLAFFLDPKCGKHRRTVMTHSVAWLGKHISKGVVWPIVHIV